MDFETEFNILFETIFWNITCDHCNMPFVCSERRHEISKDIYIMILEKRKKQKKNEDEK